MNRRYMLILAASMVCAGPAAVLRAEPATSLGLAEAEAMAKRAQLAADDRKLDVAIVVVNREGRVILAHRMDKSSFVNLALAEKKAVTAAATGVPTSLLEKAVDGGKASLLSVPDITMIAGGVPVPRGGTVIGGVGVSGGSAEDDEKIARAAAGS
ncbi:GlcG/HbpS family heme-binding protein [Sphingopyxis fribergensis]